jgi:phage host-nuclease inhibitor protein Gam
MREMLRLLTERGDDPERVKRYEALISETEQEIEAFEKTLARYEKYGKGIE